MIAALVGDIGIIANDLHAGAHELLGHNGTNLSKADDTGNLSVQFFTHKLISAEVLVLCRMIGLRNISEQSIYQGHAHFSGRHGIAVRGIDHSNASAGTCLHINVVHTISRTTGNLQVDAAFDNILFYLGGTSDNDGIILVNNLKQFLMRNTKGCIHLKALASEIVNTIGSHLVCYDNLCHITILLLYAL